MFWKAILSIFSYLLNSSSIHTVHNVMKLKLNSVAWVRERTILTERPPLVGEVSAKFLPIERASDMQLCLWNYLFTFSNFAFSCRIWCHGSDYEEFRLLGCGAVWDYYKPTFPTSQKPAFFICILFFFIRATCHIELISLNLITLMIYGELYKLEISSLSVCKNVFEDRLSLWAKSDCLSDLFAIKADMPNGIILVQYIHKVHWGFWKILYYVAFCVSLNVGVTIHAKLDVWIL
jgi:hypothetical protein